MDKVQIKGAADGWMIQADGTCFSAHGTPLKESKDGKVTIKRSSGKSEQFKVLDLIARNFTEVEESKLDDTLEQLSDHQDSKPDLCNYSDDELKAELAERFEHRRNSALALFKEVLRNLVSGYSINHADVQEIVDTYFYGADDEI